MRNKLMLLAALLSLHSPALAQSVIPSNTVSIGIAGSTNKTIEFNKAKAGTSSNPKIRFNNSTTKLQYTNDGTNYSDIGSGGGGAGGIELLADNPDFEGGISTAWTQSSAGTVTARTGTNALFGSTSARFQATSSGQTYKSTAYSVSPGIFGSPCLGLIRYNTTENSNKYSLEVVNADGDILNSVTLEATTQSQWGYVPFQCPQSSATANQKSLSLQVKSSGSATFIDLDNAHLGSDTRLTDVSQARLIASASFPLTASCGWTTTSSTFADFPTEAACPGISVQYSSIAVDATDTNLPQIKFPSLGAGTYKVSFTLSTGVSNNGSSNGLQISDGTNVRGAVSMLNSAINSDHPVITVSGIFKYTSSQSNLVFKIQGKTSSGSYWIDNSTAAYSTAMQINVEFIPDGSETALRVDQLGWHVDANISGANPSLGTSAVTTYTGIESGSLTLTNNSGNGAISARIGCSSTNAPTGTTCSSGNESVSVSWAQPSAGDVIACASFTWQFNVGSGNIGPAFQIVETATNSQTIVQEGKSRVQAWSNTGQGMQSIRVCGTFSFTGSGEKMLRLMYEQIASGAPSTSQINADGDSNNGQRDIHWEVYPLNYLSGAMPIFRGMVTSSSSGRSKIEYIKFGGGGGEGNNCTSNPCTIIRQSGGFSTVNRRSSGAYTLNHSGTFTSATVCTGNATVAGTGHSIVDFDDTTPTASATYVRTRTSANALTDSSVTVMCMGAN